MKIYTLTWFTATALTVLTGATFALWAAPTYTVIVLFVTIAVCGGVISANLRHAETSATKRHIRTCARVVVDAILAALVVMACFGIGTAIGAWLVPLVAGLTITSPTAYRALSHWLKRFEHPERSTNRTFADVADGALDRWTDSELYAVWCATEKEAHLLAETRGALTAARARDLLLSEIERRYPSMTAAWLSSESALMGEPPRFLLTGDT